MIQSKYKSWPFKEAQKLLKRFKQAPENPVRFETGFGPSGLPHIGTFSEIARTTWVRHAFEHLSQWTTQLIAFSDDMDGLRKVPTNMPHQEMLADNLGKPLCQIPDPFGRYESYSAHMNHKLKEFLDRYQFDYVFQSSFDAYTRGDFNEGLAIILQRVEEVKKIILPTMSEEKRVEWSPIFPICEKCGRINSTRVTDYHQTDNKVDYICDREDGALIPCGHHGTTSIFNGKVKVGWKIDWALRWYAYDIGYEMYGKDLIDSAKLSGKIVRLMGKQPPSGFFYELFLDEDGRKISKSVGKGITIDSWTSYAPLNSLLFFIFQNPNQAKRLFWGVIPKSVDDYLDGVKKYGNLTPEKKPDSATWHLFAKGEKVPDFSSSITFSLINNLISAVGSDNVNLIMEYLKRYDATVETFPSAIEDLVKKAMNYYRDFILPNKKYRIPVEEEKIMLMALSGRLSKYMGNDENELQTLPFDVARTYDAAPKDFFKTIYEILLGQERGPRFGTFVNLLGKEKVIAMLEDACQTENKDHLQKG